ncbi:MAG: IPTL-CTERM sorting domain-containing protein, partial [Xanthomonadales bacterium]|nr:IPTL-CTERM sorting domain-containing protein [Xanthomonadales bacterium]
NQATINFDADGNGSNEASTLSDDPSVPGGANPTVTVIGALVPVPATDRFGLLLLALLLAGVGVIGIRRR